MSNVQFDEKYSGNNDNWKYLEGTTFFTMKKISFFAFLNEEKI